MSNPKFVIPMILLLMLACFYAGATAVMDAQQRQAEQSGKIVDLASDQARAIIPLAEGNRDAIDKLGDVIDWQRSDIGMLRCAFVVAVLIIGVLASVLVWRRLGDVGKEKKEARRE